MGAQAQQPCAKKARDPANGNDSGREKGNPGSQSTFIIRDGVEQK